MDRDAFFTTCNQEQYSKYGRTMIHEFLTLWPVRIKIHLYAEGFTPAHEGPRLIVHSFEACCGDAVKFADKCTATQRSYPYDYNRDVGKFAKKSWVIVHGTTQDYADRMFWLDADTLSYKRPPDDFIDTLLPSGFYASYLGRKGYHNEGGFYGFNTKHARHAEFMQRWMDYYSFGDVFELQHQHDCGIFTDLVRKFDSPSMRFLNLTPEAQRTDHCFVTQSPLAPFMDHMKGVKRKEIGRSPEFAGGLG